MQYFADDGLDRSVREMAERERLGMEEVCCTLKLALDARLLATCPPPVPAL